MEDDKVREFDLTSECPPPPALPTRPSTTSEAAVVELVVSVW